LGSTVKIQEKPHIVLVHGVRVPENGQYDWEQLKDGMLFNNEKYNPGLEITRIAWRNPKGLRSKK